MESQIRSTLHSIILAIIPWQDCLSQSETTISMEYYRWHKLSVTQMLFVWCMAWPTSCLIIAKWSPISYIPHLKPSWWGTWLKNGCMTYVKWDKFITHEAFGLMRYEYGHYLLLAYNLMEKLLLVLVCEPVHFSVPNGGTNCFYVFNNVLLQRSYPRMFQVEMSTQVN